MSRHLGVGSWLAETLAVAEPFFAILTQLGDTWLLAALAVALYSLGSGATLPGWDRRRGALVLAAVLLAVATTGLLKTTFALPRPPGAGEPAYGVGGLLGIVYDTAATAEGFGFPSGHAIGAATVYGTIAGLVAPAARRRTAIATAGLVFAVVLCRLALGLHYGVDVLVGAAIGLGLAATTARVLDRPSVAFGASAVVAGGWTVTSGATAAAVGTLGLGVGATVAWLVLGDRVLRVAAPTGRWRLAVPVASLGVGAVALAAIESGGPAGAALAGVSGMGLVVAMPLVVR